MNENQLYTSLTIIITLFIIGCSSPKSNDVTIPEIDETLDTIIDIEDSKQIDLNAIRSINLRPKGIQFQYELGETSSFGENYMMKISCQVSNNTNHEINYLCQSCNGLDYFLVINPNSYKVAPMLNCNVTYPIIKKMKANSSIEFKTQLLKFKDAEPLENVGLDFRIVDRSISFDNLNKSPELIERIYRAKTDEKNVIWSEQ